MGNEKCKVLTGKLNEEKWEKREIILKRAFGKCVVNM
jgi:hypothetical protein